MLSSATARVFRFGVFEVDTHARELRRQGMQIKLQEQPFQILAFLVEHAGEIVTREQLRQQLWPADTFVDVDNSLNAAVNRLREALGDSAESPRFVETLPRRGYRFVAPVTEVKGGEVGSARDSVGSVTQARPVPAQTAADSKQKFLSGKSIALVLVVLLVVTSIWAWQRWRARVSAPHRPITSLAVLPLENLSGDKEQEYFADGMTDELITNLAKISAIRVISRTSVIQYKKTRKPLPQIGKELNVDAVVEGTVTREGNRVRITAQLIRANTDKHLWAEEYDGDLGDILKLQGHVARAITDEIQVKLTPQENLRLSSARPVNPESHEAYLKGRYYLDKWSADGTKVAIGYFQQAIEKDPNSALAYAGLAECYMHWSPLPPKESRAKAKAAAMKAMELDETLGEAHASLASIRFLDDWDLPGAEKEFKRAIELNPSYGEAHHEYSHYLMQMGRTQESLAEASRFFELDPLSPAPNLHLGWCYLFTEQYDRAIEQLQKTLKMDPNYVEAHGWLGQTYEQKKMYAQAVAELQKAVALSVGDSYYRSLLGHAFAISGKRDQAKTIIAALKAESSPASPTDVETAIVYTGRGNRDQAFEWWARAYQRRSGYMTYFFRVNPMFHDLHSDPRFADLLRRIGLPK